MLFSPKTVNVFGGLLHYIKDIFTTFVGYFDNSLNFIK